MLLLKEFLECDEYLLRKYCKELRNIFGYSFNEESFRNLLKLKSLSENNESLIH